MENMVFSLRDLHIVRPGTGAFRLHVRSLDVRQGQLLAELDGPQRLRQKYGTGRAGRHPAA